jgi:two-component system cell cycle response regulator
VTLRNCLAAAVVSAPPVQTGRYLPLVLAVVATVVVAVAMAHWLTRRAARRLTELAIVVSRIAGGDLSARAPVLDDGEVGRLGETFNRMTRDLRAYGEALGASRDQLRGHLSLLGDTLSSTHDLPRMLAVMLRAALVATGARAGVVLLAEPGEVVLVGQCGQGLAERGGEEWPLRLPLGAGLLGMVALSGQPVRGRSERDAPGLAAGEPHGRTYIAVPFTGAVPAGAVPFAGPVPPASPTPLASQAPLAGPIPLATRRQRPPDRSHQPDRSQQPVLGVLALYDRLGNDEFDEEDQAMLGRFAACAAVAVQNVRVHEEAQRLSYTDPLTGLYNYRMLRESLRRESERAIRFGHRLCLLVLDLDRFKEVNDSYGHAAGDAVLAEFARRLRAEVREVDLSFRQGGEEFVLLLPETDVQGGRTLAERLGTAMRGTAMTVTARRMPEQQRIPAHESDGAARTLRIPVTVSIGIAVFPDHGGTGAAVLDAADDALYAAKAAGRDTYRVAMPPRVPAPAPASTAAPAPHAAPQTARAAGDGSAPPMPIAGGSAPPRPVDGGSASPLSIGGGGAPLPSAGDSASPHAPRQSRGR